MVGLDPAAAKLLDSKGKHSCRDVLQLSVLELAELMDVPDDDAGAILALLGSAAMPKPHTVS